MSTGAVQLGMWGEDSGLRLLLSPFRLSLGAATALLQAQFSALLREEGNWPHPGNPTDLSQARGGAPEPT